MARPCDIGSELKVLTYCLRRLACWVLEDELEALWFTNCQKMLLTQDASSSILRILLLNSGQLWQSGRKFINLGMLTFDGYIFSGSFCKLAQRGQELLTPSQCNAEPATCYLVLGSHRLRSGKLSRCFGFRGVLVVNGCSCDEFRA